MILALILGAFFLVMTFSRAAVIRMSTSSSISSSLEIFWVVSLGVFVTVLVSFLTLQARSRSRPSLLYMPPLESLIATTLEPNRSLTRNPAWHPAFP